MDTGGGNPIRPPFNGVQDERIYRFPFAREGRTVGGMGRTVEGLAERQSHRRQKRNPHSGRNTVPSVLIVWA